METIAAYAENCPVSADWLVLGRESESTHIVVAAPEVRGVTPNEALDILRDAITRQPAAEPSAERAASQLEALRAENAALKAELKKLRTSRGHGKTKVHVPPREAPPASDQRETG